MNPVPENAGFNATPVDISTIPDATASSASPFMLTAFAIILCTIESCFEEKPDYVIDAIDSTDGKLAIWKYCQENGIPFIACLGAARRLEPEQLIVTTLNKTEKDPLARKLRYLARQKGMDLKLKVVCSKEDPLPMHESGVLGSMIFVPAMKHTT